MSLGDLQKTGSRYDLSTRLSICSYLSISSAFRASVYHLSIYSSIHPSIHLSIHLSIHPSIYPSIHLSTHLSIYLFIYIPILLFIYNGKCVETIFQSFLRTPLHLHLTTDVACIDVPGGAGSLQEDGQRTESEYCMELNRGEILSLSDHSMDAPGCTSMIEK